jgi:DNA-directed RNA polymerase subunit F
MIKNMKALSLAEAKQLIDENKGKEELEPYLKKFIKLKLKETQELRKELEELKNHKIKAEHIANIIDFLPEDASDINKIFTDVSLDDNEIKQITGIVAKYK